MANDLTQDPLFFDGNATGVRVARIRAVKYVGAGTPTIVDGVTAHPVWSTDETCFDDINVTIPSEDIDVTVPSGSLYIYLGSGPR